MKTTLVALASVIGLAAQLSAGETLRLKLETDRDFVLTGAAKEVIVKIDLAAAPAKHRHRRTPLNLAVALDRSGSMTGAKIKKARQAAMELVDWLDHGDYFSLIAYNNQVEVIVPVQEVRNKEAIKARIAAIKPNGGTALHAGVQQAAEELQKHFSTKRINRVILLSDGLANVGPSSPAELRKLGGSLSERGIAVTTIGVGDDYNENLMSGLAEASDANYYYVKDTEKLPSIFAKELGRMLHFAAREIRIEIECPKGVKPIGFLGRPETFTGQQAMIRFSDFTPEQDRSVFLRCLVVDTQPEIARVKVRYLDELNGGSESELSGNLKIQFTEDRDKAAKSERASVATERELLLAAIAKDEAILEADRSRYQEAAARLDRQADVLDAQAVTAPPGLQSQVRSESLNLRSRAGQMRANQYTPGDRKDLQSESWTYRNAK